jgi:hypothetical protein
MTDTVRFEVVKTVGQIEIRRYPKLILATVAGMDDSDSFQILFDYISGNNQPNRKIAMTAPVMSGRRLEKKIAMTTPVLSTDSAFSFVLPAEFTPETVPVPMDPRLRLEEVPERMLAVIRFHGVARGGLVERERTELLSLLDRNGIKPRGEPFLMRYDPPFMPGFIRHNEIAVEIAEV